MADRVSGVDAILGAAETCGRGLAETVVPLTCAAGLAQSSAAYQAAGDVVVGKLPGWAFLIEPSIADGFGKKRDLEDPDVNRAPLGAVESLGEIASAK